MAPRWIAVAGLVYHLVSGASVLSPSDNTAQTLTNGWHAWRVPAVREAQSRCCYGSHGSSDTTAGCHLDGRSGGFTTRANADVESDETKVFAQVAAGLAAAQFQDRRVQRGPRSVLCKAGGREHQACQQGKGGNVGAAHGVSSGYKSFANQCVAYNPTDRGDGNPDPPSFAIICPGLLDFSAFAEQ